MVTSNDKWKLYFHVVGASKCRTFEIKIKQSIDFSKEPIHIVTNCQNLAKEVRACGKCGACMRLKRALEEEKENDKKSKKPKESVAVTSKIEKKDRN